MANLSFFALKEDFVKIFDFIFSQTDIIVYEDYSRYNLEIRQFHSTQELFKAYQIGLDVHGGRDIVLSLYSPSVMAEPIIKKIDLGKGEFRYNVEGWAIIRLHLGGKYKNNIILSELSHNSLERAKKWALTYGINVTGPYLVADEAKKIWQVQGLKNSMVVTTSANAAVAKSGSVAYDTSKAAANHLVRELAIELSPLVRVNGLAPATVVEGSSMFPRDRVISSLTKYNIAFDENESTEDLRDKLAMFYAQRTLTKSPITLADQAEMAYLLSSSKFSKTTGQIISVDGGLHEAFLR